MENYTFRNLYNEIIANETMSEAAKEKAKNALIGLDKKNNSRSSKPSKTQIANEPIKAAILEKLNSTPITAADMGISLEITTSKASALLLQLVKDGKAEQTEIKISGKGKVKGYTLAVTE